MKFQWQILCVHVLKSQLYMLQFVNKEHLCCPSAKHQNTANLALQTCEKNWWTALWHHMFVDFSSRNIFNNLGFFAKVTVPVESIIPWWNLGRLQSRKLFLVIVGDGMMPLRCFYRWKSNWQMQRILIAFLIAGSIPFLFSLRVRFVVPSRTLLLIMSIIRYMQ